MSLPSCLLLQNLMKNKPKKFSIPPGATPMALPYNYYFPEKPIIDVETASRVLLAVLYALGYRSPEIIRQICTEVLADCLAIEETGRPLVKSSSRKERARTAKYMKKASAQIGAGIDAKEAAGKSVVAGLAVGEQAVCEGKTLTQAQAKKRMAKWLKPKRPKQR